MANPITVTMEGTLLNWLKNVGDSVKSGEVVAEIEADKATVEIEATADGVLTQQAAKVGDSVAEGAVIGQIGAAGEAGAAQPVAAPASASGASASAAPKLPPVSTPAPAKSNGAPQPAPVAEEDGNLPDGVKASPIARKIAAENKINLRQVKGTGPGGRIVKEDVENFVHPPAHALPPEPAEDRPLIESGPAAYASGII
ncbi:MAG: E3 binding domain-containing protein, partial [Anaerolineae bacterium]|nr:E3 binding domain-containing protein [Anaerolineae bacterium]